MAKTERPPSSTAADPITTEIIRNAFVSCAQDMNATLIRSSYTPIIYEGKDCSVAILDENGDVLGQSLGLPLFLGNLEICVKLAAEMFGWEAFRPGDVFHMNDSYMTGTHLNDATIFGPIYWRDQLVGFSATRAHWLDVGGKDAGGPMDSREIYQEGMRWGPTRIYDRGEPREDIIDLLRRNGRFGYSLVGDMNAQVAACRTGEARFQAILDRFGYETYVEARDEIYRQSEQLERDAVAALPDGTYRADGFLDNDGRGHGPIAVQLRIDIEGDSMKLDLEGSSPQMEGPVNCGFAQTVSACRVAFKLLINPERPVDGGTFHTLDVKAPPASIFDAQEPAACQWYFSSLGSLDRPGRDGARSDPARQGRGGAFRRLDGDVPRRQGSAPRRPAVPLRDAARRRLGRLRGRRRRGRADQQRQRRLQGLPRRGVRGEVPGVDSRATASGPTPAAPVASAAAAGSSGASRSSPTPILYLWLERSVTPAWGLFGGRDAIGPDVIVNPGRPDERRMLKVNAHPLTAGLGRRPQDRRRRRLRRPVRARPGARSQPTCSTGSSAARRPSATTASCSTTD